MIKKLITSAFLLMATSLAFADGLFTIKDLSGGIQNDVDSTMIDDNAVQDAQNVLFDEDTIAEKRKGIARLNTTQMGSADNRYIYGQFEYARSDNSVYHIVQCSATVYYRNTGNEFTAFGSTVALTYPCNYAVFMDTLNYCNGVDNIRAWNTNTSWTQTTSYQPKYIFSWQNRLWIAGDSDAPSTIRSSGFLNPRDWVDTVYLSTSPFSVDVNGQDGQDVTGFFNSPNGNLGIFKNKSVYELSGSDSDNFSLKLKISDIGCINVGSVAYKDGIVYWLSSRGWIAYDGNTYQIVSKDIINTIDNIQQLQTGDYNFTKATQEEWETNFSTSGFIIESGMAKSNFITETGTSAYIRGYDQTTMADINSNGSIYAVSLDIAYGEEYGKLHFYNLQLSTNIWVSTIDDTVSPRAYYIAEYSGVSPQYQFTFRPILKIKNNTFHVLWAEEIRLSAPSTNYYTLNYASSTNGVDWTTSTVRSNSDVLSQNIMSDKRCSFWYDMAIDTNNYAHVVTIESTGTTKYAGQFKVLYTSITTTGQWSTPLVISTDTDKVHNFYISDGFYPYYVTSMDITESLKNDKKTGRGNMLDIEITTTTNKINIIYFTCNSTYTFQSWGTPDYWFKTFVESATIIYSTMSVNASTTTMWLQNTKLNYKLLDYTESDPYNYVRGQIDNIFLLLYNDSPYIFIDYYSSTISRAAIYIAPYHVSDWNTNYSFIVSTGFYYAEVSESSARIHALINNSYLYFSYRDSFDSYKTGYWFAKYNLLTNTLATYRNIADDPAGMTGYNSSMSSGLFYKDSIFYLVFSYLGKYIDTTYYREYRGFVIKKSSSTYLSEIHNTTLDSYYYQLLKSDYVNYDYNVTQYLRSDTSEANISTNSWTSVTNNTVPSLTPKRYIQYKIEFSSDIITDEIPYIDRMELDFRSLTGSKKISSAYYKDRVYNAVSIDSQTVLDTFLVLDTNNRWTKFKYAINPTYIINYRNNLYISDDSGYVYSADVNDDDAGQPISAYFKTKDYDLGSILGNKSIDNLYTVNNFKGDWNLNLDYYLNKANSYDSTYSINLGNFDNIKKTKIPLTTRPRFNTINFKFHNSNLGEPFDLLGIYLKYKEYPLE